MKAKLMYLNVRAIVDFFGGGTNMAALFDKYHFRPVPRTHFYKWVERNSMPLERWLEAEYIAIKEGIYKDLRKVAVITKSDPQGPAARAQVKSPST